MVLFFLAQEDREALWSGSSAAWGTGFVWHAALFCNLAFSSSLCIHSCIYQSINLFFSPLELFDHRRPDFLFPAFSFTSGKIALVQCSNVSLSCLFSCGEKMFLYAYYFLMVCLHSVMAKEERKRNQARAHACAVTKINILEWEPDVHLP